MNHAELRRKLLSDPETRAAYRDMTPEFALLEQMLSARTQAGLSQAEVASRMGTKAPAGHPAGVVAGQRQALAIRCHAALVRQAVRCDLEIRFVKRKSTAA